MVWKNINKLVSVRKKRPPDKSPRNAIACLAKANKLAYSCEVISNDSDIDEFPVSLLILLCITRNPVFPTSFWHAYMETHIPSQSLFCCRRRWNHPVHLRSATENQERCSCTQDDYGSRTCYEPFPAPFKEAHIEAVPKEWVGEFRPTALTSHLGESSGDSQELLHQRWLCEKCPTAVAINQSPVRRSKVSPTLGLILEHFRLLGIFKHIKISAT
jgi:hypothetical protein